MEIEDLSKINNKTKKIIYFFRNLFIIIGIEKLNNNIICYIPKNYIKIMNKFIAKIVSKKICNVLYDNNINNVVLSNKLKTNNIIINAIQSENIEILDGRELFKDLILKIIEYVLSLQNEDISKYEITLLTNDLSNNVINNIIYLSNKVKVLNVVTNNIKDYKKVEEKIYNKFGILIRITNNKRKSLANTKLIFNIDFPEEILNEYIIYDKAIIINICKKIKILSKKFNGINVNYYNIKLPIEYKNFFSKYNIYRNFNENELYESILYNDNGKDFFNRINNIEDNNVSILNLIGENGVISENNIKYIDKL